MSKIAKLTWLHNGNYGSILQAVALQKVLRDNGFNVTDIDYKANMKTKLINYLTNRNSPDLFLGKLQEAKCRRMYPHMELFNQRTAKMNAFEQNNMILSPQYRNPKELKGISCDYDI